MYEVSKPIENFRSGSKHISGLVLKEYAHPGIIRANPVYAVGGPREYLSEMTSKNSGKVYIPLRMLEERQEFKIVMGKRGSRHTFYFKNCRLQVVGSSAYWYGELWKTDIEELQPKEVPVVAYWQREKAA